MQFIIDFQNDASQSEIDQYLLDNMCQVVKQFSAFDKVYVVEAASQPQPSSSLVDVITPDIAGVVNLLTDMTWSVQTNDDWWKVTSAVKPDLSASTISYDRSGASSIVYLVDSGVKLDHSEFVGANVSNLFSFNADFVDYNGHGTALASTIVGQTCGITNATLKSVKIFQDGVATLTSDLLSAFDSIIQDAALNDNKMKVVNLSWSIPKNTYIETKIQLLIDSGFLVVAPSGNNGTAIQDVTPASMPGVITVGSFSDNLIPSNFSNYTGYLDTANGPVNYGALDVWAPGEGIRVAALDGSIQLTGGTSIASAIHSAALAFNSFLIQLSDGSIVSEESAIAYVAAITSAKYNLLSLTGVYENSINSITQLITEKYGENGWTPRESRRKTIFLYNSVPVNIQIFKAFSVESYQAPALPAGLSLDNGWLTGQVADITQNALQTVAIPFTRFDMTTGTFEMTLVDMLDNQTVEQLDQELQIQLQAGPCQPIANPFNPGFFVCEPDATDCPANSLCDDRNLVGTSKNPANLDCGCVLF